mmetsp:Transcript_50472/g.163362  ORF Transcript_50472/g.163362 Transcript_50472/m.163362 type:complete len:244 (+) Transcript_50472:878-1609(+)
MKTSPELTLSWKLPLVLLLEQLSQLVTGMLVMLEPQCHRKGRTWRRGAKVRGRHSLPLPRLWPRQPLHRAFRRQLLKWGPPPPSRSRLRIATSAAAAAAVMGSRRHSKCMTEGATTRNMSQVRVAQMMITEQRPSSRLLPGSIRHSRRTRAARNTACRRSLSTCSLVRLVVGLLLVLLPMTLPLVLPASAAGATFAQVQSSVPPRPGSSGKLASCCRASSAWEDAACAWATWMKMHHGRTTCM